MNLGFTKVQKQEGFIYVVQYFLNKSFMINFNGVLTCIPSNLLDFKSVYFNPLSYNPTHNGSLLSTLGFRNLPPLHKVQRAILDMQYEQQKTCKFGK